MIRKPAYPPPLKHLRYHGQVAMSVCIAAICSEGPRIVLCSDLRIDHGYLGSTKAHKFDIIGRNWVALKAGAWEPVCEFTNVVKRAFDDAPLNTRAGVLLAVRKAVSDFRVSPLYRKNCCQLLISGFTEPDVPMVIQVNPDLSTETVSCGAIGEGATIAMVMLNQRGYSPDALSVDELTYIAYEAKRCSEKVGSVGVSTSLLIHRPLESGNDSRPYIANMGVTTDRGVAAGHTILGFTVVGLLFGFGVAIAQSSTTTEATFAVAGAGGVLGAFVGICLSVSIAIIDSN